MRADEDSVIGSLPNDVRRELEFLEATYRPEIVFAEPIEAALLSAELEDRKQRLMSFGREALRVLEALRAVGIDVSTLNELRAKGREDARAVPVLLEFLKLGSPALRFELLECLSRPWGKSSVGPLLEIFSGVDPSEDPDPNSFRWHIMSTISRVSSDEWVEELIEVAANEKNGDSRWMAISALGRMRTTRSRIRPHLMEWLNAGDSIVNLPAAQVLAKWRDFSALPDVKALIARELEDDAGTEDLKSWRQAEFRKVLRSLEPKS